MSDIIRLLPDSVANQIAAGEVIQRPASVIKELVENAVDAGATTIDIVLKDAGRTLIQVIDNGSGMTENDARMAFERHATSKIVAATDLYALRTMGFRGEALPSIAAVAQIDLRTMTENQQIGTRLLINASQVESQIPQACRKGTNLMVKNLFFNLPVRRKFLKKDTVELAAIMREFERLALVNENIEFSVTHNEALLHRLLPSTFKQRIISLFGQAMERQLIPVEAASGLVNISGYISLPEFSRRRGALQFLMVNGRNMRHPYFHKAIMQCFEPLIPHDRQPCYFLRFTVDPQSIDVNIHPTKNEIKFEDEQSIWQILTAAVRESLNRYNAVPAIDFDREDAPDIPAFELRADAEMPRLDIDTSFNPFATQPQSAPKGGGGTHGKVERPDSLRDWTRLYESFNRDAAAAATASAADADGGEARPVELFDADALTSAEPSGTLQIHNKYIVVPSREGMLVIDQHRAHLAVLYGEYLSRLATGAAMESQQVLFAEPLELSPAQSAVLEAVSPELATLGFALERDAAQGWSVTAQPAALEGLNPAEAIMRIIEAAADAMGSEDDRLAQLRGRIALTLAESAAISGSRPLVSAEREQLVASLMSQPNPRFTADGRVIFVTITADDLAGLF